MVYSPTLAGAGCGTPKARPGADAPEEVPSEASSADGADGAECPSVPGAESSGPEAVAAILEELSRVVAQASAKDVRTPTADLERVLERATEASEALDPEDDVFVELAEQATAANDLLALRRKSARAARRVLGAIPAEDRWWEAKHAHLDRTGPGNRRQVSFNFDFVPDLKFPAFKADEVSTAATSCEPSPRDSKEVAPATAAREKAKAEERPRECTSCSTIYSFFAMLRRNREAS